MTRNWMTQWWWTVVVNWWSHGKLDTVSQRSKNLSILAIKVRGQGQMSPTFNHFLWFIITPITTRLIVIYTTYNQVTLISHQYRVPTIFWWWNSRTFQGLSRTIKLHVQGPILAWTVLQQHLMSVSVITGQF